LQAKVEKCDNWVSSQQENLLTGWSANEDDGQRRANIEISAAVSRLEESLQKMENKQVRTLN
jgi:hypothetical protein